MSACGRGKPRHWCISFAVKVAIHFLSSTLHFLTFSRGEWQADALPFEELTKFLNSKVYPICLACNTGKPHVKVGGMLSNLPVVMQIRLAESL